jgi:hypothetical protein
MHDRSAKFKIGLVSTAADIAQSVTNHREQLKDSSPATIE